MKATFIFGFLLGFIGLLLGAYFVPWTVNERVAAIAGVAMNGGRQETFIIRLPADRIVSVGGTAAAPLATDPIARIEPAADLASSAFAAEQFKVRNLDGVVVGVGTRHWVAADGSAASTWAVSVPSRGTIVFAGEGDTPARLRDALTRAGYRQGSEWTGEISFDVADESPRVVTGTEEFGRAAGRFMETWTITGVTSEGELRGTITLDTIVNQSS